MSLILALLASVAFGVADFFSGTAARRSSPVAVTIISMPLGAVPLTITAFFIPSSSIGSAWLWGVAGGTIGGLALIVFLHAMSIGRMSVVGPLSAVATAAMPVLAGIITGEKLQATAYLGILLACGAVFLIGAGDNQTTVAVTSSTRLSVCLALASGIGFGTYFAFVGLASEDSGLWPVVAGFVSTWLVAIVLGVLTRSVSVPDGETLHLTIWYVVTLVAANVLYLIAARVGLLTLAGVAVALYPASTVLLARFVHDEHLSRAQIIGFTVAGGAVALLASST